LSAVLLFHDIPIQKGARATNVEGLVSFNGPDIRLCNMVRTTSDKQNSSTFQGQITVFED